MKYCWIFQNIKDNVNAPNVQCYELNEVVTNSYVVDTKFEQNFVW